MDLLLDSLTLYIPNLLPMAHDQGVLCGEEGAQTGGVLCGGQGAGEGENSP